MVHSFFQRTDQAINVTGATSWPALEGNNCTIHQRSLKSFFFLSAVWYSTLLIHWQEKFSQLLFSWKIDSVVISRLNTLRPLILGYCIQQCTLNTKWTQIAPTMNSRGTTTFFLYQHCVDASCGHFKHLIYWRKQHNNWLMSVDYTFCIC